MGTSHFVEEDEEKDGQRKRSYINKKKKSIDI